MKLIYYRDRSPKREWRWKMIAANGRKVANAGEGYRRFSHCKAMAHNIFGPAIAAGRIGELKTVYRRNGKAA